MSATPLTDLPWLALTSGQSFLRLPRGIPADAQQIRPGGGLLVLAVGAEQGERLNVDKQRRVKDFAEAGTLATSMAESLKKPVLIVGERMAKLGKDEVRPVLASVMPEPEPEPERETEAKSVRETIRHEGNQWCVYSEDGKRSFGCYDSEKAAQDRLAQIERFKVDLSLVLPDLPGDR